MKLPMIFLGERHSGYFRLKSVTETTIGHNQQKPTKTWSQDLTKDKLLHYNPSNSVLGHLGSALEMTVVVEFHCSVFASFAQCLLFDFGGEPLLKKDFNIDVLSKGMESTIRQLTSVREELSQVNSNIDENRIIRMERDEEENKLVASYSLPKDAERIVSAQMVDQCAITPDHYVQVMHQLLYAEEAHMKTQLMRLVPQLCLQ